MIDSMKIKVSFGALRAFSKSVEAGGLAPVAALDGVSAVVDQEDHRLVVTPQYGRHLLRRQLERPAGRLLRWADVRSAGHETDPSRDGARSGAGESHPSPVASAALTAVADQQRPPTGQSMAAIRDRRAPLVRARLGER
jgi:hypothetical protein